MPALSWRARAYWADAKGGQSQLAAGVLPHRDIAQDMLFQLYAVLGGSSRPSSPLFIKGGAAASLYLCQQGAILEAYLPVCFSNYVPATDFDFGTSGPAGTTLARAIGALGWLATLPATNCLVKRLEHRWPLWMVRQDGIHGEAFQSGTRYAIGGEHNKTLPIKASYHGGLVEYHSGRNFSLIRLGLAV